MFRPMTLGAVAVLALAACGGGGSDDSAAAPIVIQGASETADASTDDAAAIDGDASDGDASDSDSTDADAASSPGVSSDEQQALDFADCMRDNGVEDFPDPEVTGNGEVTFGVGPGAGGGGGGGGGGNGLAGDPDFQDAFDECGDILDGAAFGPGNIDQTELEDNLLEFAQCLRDQGLDVDDPDLDNFGPGGGGAGGGGGGIFGDGFDPQDPANQDALQACQGIFAGGPFGGGAGGGN